MIQDIRPRKYDITYQNVLPEKDDFALMFFSERVLMKHTGENRAGFVSFAELADCFKLNHENLRENSRFLFTIDDKRFFLMNLEDIETPFAVSDFEKETADGVYKWTEQTEFRTLDERWICYAGVTAMQLYRWYKNRRYCGCCGSELAHSPRERAMVCPNCDNTEYPKISPAVIVGITDGNKLLLTRYADRPHKRYALIAGFGEVGETLEETVKREVMEEVGLKVKDITYYKSQPWSFSDSLLVGFFARLDGSNKVTLQDGELAEGTWIEREEIPVPQEEIALTAEMIRYFANGNDPFE